MRTENIQYRLQIAEWTFFIVIHRNFTCKSRDESSAPLQIAQRVSYQRLPWRNSHFSFFQLPKAEQRPLRTSKLDRYLISN
jgi:hypothetical protein